MKIFTRAVFCIEGVRVYPVTCLHLLNRGLNVPFSEFFFFAFPAMMDAK